MAATLEAMDLMALDQVTEGYSPPFKQDEADKLKWTGVKDGVDTAIDFQGILQDEQIRKLNNHDFNLAQDILDGEVDSKNALAREIIRSPATVHPLFLHDDGNWYDDDGFRLTDQPPKGTDIVKVAANLEENGIPGKAGEDGAKPKNVEDPRWNGTQANYYSYADTKQYTIDSTYWDAEFGGPAVNVGGRMQGTPKTASGLPDEDLLRAAEAGELGVNENGDVIVGGAGSYDYYGYYDYGYDDGYYGGYYYYDDYYYGDYYYPEYYDQGYDDYYYGDYYYEDYPYYY